MTTMLSDFVWPSWNIFIFLSFSNDRCVRNQYGLKIRTPYETKQKIKQSKHKNLNARSITEKEKKKMQTKIDAAK